MIPLPYFLRFEYHNINYISITSILDAALLSCSSTKCIYVFWQTSTECPKIFAIISIGTFFLKYKDAHVCRNICVPFARTFVSAAISIASIVSEIFFMVVVLLFLVDNT